MYDNFFLMVWVIYKGDSQDLDIPLPNSFDPYIMEELQSMGIEATLPISYVPANEADQLGEPWTR